MKQKLCLLCCLLAWWSGPGRVLAQITSVQFVQSAIPYNELSTGSLVSSTTSTNFSNGQGYLTFAFSPGFNHQFSSLVSFGGGVAPTNLANLAAASGALTGSNPNYSAVAQAAQWPVGVDSSSTVVMVLQSAQIGAPYVSAPNTYNFGSVIPPPLTDVRGVLLPNNVAGYWQTVPWTTNNFDPASTPYYYSPNAGTVFATQPGQIQVTWISASPTNSAVNWSNYVNPGGAYPSFVTNGGGVFPLYTSTYIISGLPVKTPHKMYWTEGSFANLGYPINVANGRVSAVHVVYNTQFPQTVTTPYVDPNVVLQTAATNSLQEFRTLWFDPTENQIRAYNAQGRVFVELLGAPNASAGNSQYLGFEIVDVAEAPTAANVTSWLGRF